MGVRHCAHAGIDPAIVRDAWINGWARAPGHFLMTVLLLTAMLLYSGRMARRTGNDMGVTWRGSLGNTLGKVPAPYDWLYRLRTSAGYIKLHDVLRRTVAPALFAVLFVYLGVTLISRTLYNVQDYAGLVCKETPDQASLHRLGRSDEIILANKKSYRLNEQQKSDPFSAVKEDLPVFRTDQFCQSAGRLSRARRAIPDHVRKYEIVPRWRGRSGEGLLLQRAGQPVASGGDVRRHPVATRIDAAMVPHRREGWWAGW